MFLKRVLRDQSGNASAGARLLVILYAAALVAIGWQPLSQEKGDIFDSISSAGSKIAASFSKARERRATEALKVEIEAVPPGRAETLDKLTEEDREELNKLIDDL